MNETENVNIKFEILGSPEALKRHRTFQRGNYVGTYDPSKGDKQSFLELAHKHAPAKPLAGPIFLGLTLIFPRPKSHYRSGKHSHELKKTAPKWHTGRPDKDNVDKFVMDALNNVFWVDDSQICSSVTYKLYGDKPRTIVEIEELNDDVYANRCWDGT